MLWVQESVKDSQIWEYNPLPESHPPAETNEQTAEPTAERRSRFYLLFRDVQHGVEPVTVLLPRLLLVDLVPLGLRQPQEPPDGAQVLPQRAVLGARALLPPEQLTQPTLGGGERR